MATKPMNYGRNRRKERSEEIGESEHLVRIPGGGIKAIGELTGEDLDKLAQTRGGKIMATKKRTPKAPEFETAAALVKARLREGKGKEEIEAEVQKVFPEYGAWKIAVGVYRRELRTRGELPSES